MTRTQKSLQYVDLPETDLDPALDDSPRFLDENIPPGDAFDDAFDDDPPESLFGEEFDAEAYHQKMVAELAKTDLAHFFGDSGPLSQQLDGYELRPSQLAMAEAVKRALLDRKHALLDAPTGTGKSIAYLVPALLSGKTIVVSTANKSLQSQLYTKDLPFLAQVLNCKIDAVVVKGRSNFVCTYKWDKEAFEQQMFAFVDKEHDQVKFLREWLRETDSGDVDDLPFMLDGDIRPRVVSYSDDCLQSECPAYHDNCWVNKMRDTAARAQVLITNHHLLLNALELGWAGERILPPAPIYIIDEAHQLEETATAIFEANVSDYTVAQLLRRNIFKEHLEEDEIDDLLFKNTLAFQHVSNLSRDNSFRIEVELEEMRNLARALEELAKRMKRDNPYKDDKPDNKCDGPTGTKQADSDATARKAYELAIEGVASASNKLLAVARNNHDEDFVRYATRVFDRRHITLELHAAPINPAGLLSEYLFDPEFPEESDRPKERTVICTSATLATHGNFNHFKARCGITETGEEHVLPAVFDYPTQALLYQPALPAYNYRNPDPYYNGVAREMVRLLETSRGRALCLFTSWSGLQQVRDRLMDAGNEPVWPLRAQGDAPRDALLAWFKETPHSVLLATKSFWEGVDIPGDDLSLVVLDKMPFPTPNDPLHSARMKTIDDSGRSSFGDYMLPLMTLALKQGFGRLIRRTSDNGVVAILDERLTSKGYGRQTRNDLPPARFTRDFGDVHRFYRANLDSRADFALNVSAQAAIAGAEDDDDVLTVTTVDGTQRDGTSEWRWQLLRLQDGKADQESGPLADVPTRDLPDVAAGELYAAIQGLQNLRGRIEKAKRSPAQFGVEVRCSHTTAELLAETDAPLTREWANECAQWQHVEIVGIGMNRDSEPA